MHSIKEWGAGRTSNANLSSCCLTCYCIWATRFCSSLLKGLQAAIITTFLTWGCSFPRYLPSIIISLKNPSYLKVLNSSKKTQSFFGLLTSLFSSFSLWILSYDSLILPTIDAKLSFVFPPTEFFFDSKGSPALILNTANSCSKRYLTVCLSKAVFPIPASPIMTIGMFNLILWTIRHILKKLSMLTI